MEKMTQHKWEQLTPNEREKLRDYSGLTPQLRGLEGQRIEVKTTYGELRRFWVGRSTGWKPCHLEVKTTRSLGGSPAELLYKSVRVVC